MSDFVHSPYFNQKRPEVAVLYDVLYEQQRVEWPTWQTTDVYARVFPEKAFDLQQLRYVMTDLTRLLEDFMVFHRVKRSPEQQRELLLQELHERKLDAHFARNLKQSQKAVAATTIQDGEFYRHRLRLEQVSFQNTTRRDNRAVESSLSQLNSAVDDWYFAQKLKIACEILNRSNVLSMEAELPFLDQLISHLLAHPRQENPAVQTYFQVLLTLVEPGDESHYHKLQQLLIDHAERFPGNELYDLYMFAQNYCIGRINLGQTDYLNALFSNYKTLIDKGLILENGTIAQFNFKNIVTVGLRVNEFDWVDQFITDFAPALEPDHRANAVTYNRAWLHFSRKDYRKALKLLLTVEFTDVYYHLDSKALLTKTYYELNDIEPLLSLIEAFRAYLRRNRKISDVQRKTYLNFVKFVKKLTRIKLGSRKPLEEIRSEVREARQVADLSWLELKLQEFE